MLLKCLWASNIIGGALCVALAVWSSLDVGVDSTAVVMWLLGGFGILFGGAELIYGQNN